MSLVIHHSLFPFQFYDFCTKWIEDVDDNDATYAEMEAFQVGTEMNETIARVNVRLGFEGEKVLEFSLRFWFPF